MGGDLLYFLYVIDSAGSKYFKIGYSSSTGYQTCYNSKGISTIANRIKSLQTGCPFTINIDKIFQIENKAKNLESKIHIAFDKYRQRGEWFLEDCNMKKDLAGLYSHLKDYEFDFSHMINEDLITEIDKVLGV